MARPVAGLGVARRGSILRAAFLSQVVVLDLAVVVVMLGVDDTGVLLDNTK
jgi:hypothetical protein